MARPPTVKYREDRDLYYCNYKGQQHPLAKGKANRAEAMRAFGVLLARDGGDPVARSKLTVATLCDLYIEHARANLAPLTAEWYGRHLNSFSAAQGHHAAMGTKPLHVTAWLSGHDWSESTQCGAITAVKRAFRWAKKQGYIDDNPLADLERPPMAVRDVELDGATLQKILDATPDAEFRNLCIALHETGGRLGRLISLTAAHLDLDAGFARPASPGRPGGAVGGYKGGSGSVRSSRRTNRTKPPMPLYFSAKMVELCRGLAKDHPTGYLFLNAEGRPWTRNHVAGRFRRLRKALDLGDEVTAHALRRAYATDALEKGVPIPAVAELMGHKSPAMVMRVYNKIRERKAHLRESLARFRGSDNGMTPDPSTSSAPPPAPPGDRDGDGRGKGEPPGPHAN
jgi:integrase